MTTENSDMMRKAYTYAAHGKPSDVLGLFHAIPAGKLAKDEVFVHLKAAGMNPVAYKTMKDFPSIMVKKPCIPENDFSGVVFRAGEDATEFKEGDEVFGIISGQVTMKTGEGTLTELVKVNKEALVKKPANVSFEEAACFSLTGLTAWEGLAERAELKKGDRVFINGGSGGVGVMAVQIARELVGSEGKVVASCSAANIDLVKSLGADEAIDYKSVDLPKYLGETYKATPFNGVFDTVGVQELYKHSPSFLTEDGKFVNVGVEAHGAADYAKMVVNLAANYALPSFLGGVPRKYILFMMSDSKAKLTKLAELVADGKVKAVIDSTYSLPNRDDVLAAYERIMSGRAKGKVIIKNEEPLSTQQN